MRAIDSGDPIDFQATPLGPKDGKGNPTDWQSNKAQNPKPCEKGGPAKVRAWESQGAGNTFDLEGPDAQAVTMPPTPELGSDELTAEMAEVYAQALLRDVPFSFISPDVTKEKLGKFQPCNKIDADKIKKILKALNECKWFTDQDCCKRTTEENARSRGPFTAQTFFRGITPGDCEGPYLSQFLLVGNKEY